MSPRSYRAAVSGPASARARTDELLLTELKRLHAGNFAVHRRRRMHALLKRQDWTVGRAQVERLTKIAGIRGV